MNVAGEMLKIQGGRQNKENDGRKDAMHANLEGAHISKSMFDMEKEIPADSSMGDSLGALAQGFGKNLKGARGGLQALLLGIASGMKGSANKERRQKLEKYAKIAEFWQEQSQQMGETYNKVATQKAAMEGIQENVADYNLNAASMNPLARDQYADKIVDKYNELAGTDYKRVSTDSVMPTLFTLQDKKTGQTFVKNFGTRSNGMNADLFTQAMDYEDRKMNLDRERLTVDQERVDAYKSDIANRWNPPSQFNKSAAIEQGKKGADMALKLEEVNLQMDDVLYDVDYLSDLLKEGNVITGNTLYAKNARLWAAFSGSKALSDTELFDATAKSLLKFANHAASFGNANMKEFEFLKDPVPDSAKSRSALERMVKRFKEKIQRQHTRNEQFIGRYQNFNPHQPSETREEKPSPPPEKTTQNTAPADTILMFSPKTPGKPIPIHLDDVAEARKDGMRLYQK